MKYNYYPIVDQESGKEIGIVCVGAYGGKTVRGVSKCNPADEFDYEKGKALATARCEEKIWSKRIINMGKKLMRLDDEINRLERYRDDEEEYYNYLTNSFKFIMLCYSFLEYIRNKTKIFMPS